MKNAGFQLKKPKKKCDDAKCPFHGKIKVRGRIFVGEVVAKDLNKSATVVWSRKRYIPKYERSEPRRTRVRVHNPACINANIKEIVKIMETKPLSKTKHFVIVERVEKEIKKPSKKEVAAK